MQRLIAVTSLLTLLTLTACEDKTDDQAAQPTTTQAEESDEADQPEAQPTETETTGGDSAGATLQVAEQEPHGQYLADADGRALYLFEADEDGESTCYDACADTWPPLTTDTDITAGDGVDPDMIDTTERDDGTMQVTYNGHPLYYFVRDEQPDDTNGQDVEGFGAEWYLVTPDGDKVEPEDHDDSPQ